MSKKRKALRARGNAENAQNTQPRPAAVRRTCAPCHSGEQSSTPARHDTAHVARYCSIYAVSSHPTAIFTPMHTTNARASASETSSSSACVRRLSQRQRRRDGSSACARRLVQRQRRRDGRRRCRSWRRSWRQGRSRSRRRRDGSSACVRRLGRRRRRSWRRSWPQGRGRRRRDGSSACVRRIGLASRTARRRSATRSSGDEARNPATSAATRGCLG